MSRVTWKVWQHVDSVELYISARRHVVPVQSSCCMLVIHIYIYIYMYITYIYTHSRVKSEFCIIPV